MRIIRFSIAVAFICVAALSNAAILSAVPAIKISKDSLLTSVSDTIWIQEPDSLMAADTVEISDSAYMAQNRAKYAENEVIKVIDRGSDVSSLVGARRQRSKDYTPFSAKPLMANTFVSPRLTTTKLMTEDYAFGFMGGLSIGKWVHEDHAVRLDYSIGRWKDNFDGSYIIGMDAMASYIFNITSYVGGYRTNRLCELMIVSGLGYANSIYMDKISHAMKGQIGLNLNFRLFKGVDFYIEPMAAMYTNGMAVSYAGNWRSWLSAYQTTCGMTFNIMQSYTEDSPALLPRTEGWFVNFHAGPHFQNSAVVYQEIGFPGALGAHVGLGVGKYYNDFFAMRYNLSFAESSWVAYDEDKYPCKYLSVRAETMLDLVALLRNAAGKEGRPAFSFSLIAGPEVGYMNKKDQKALKDEYQSYINTAYFGITGGVQAKVAVADRCSLYLEPRFALLPYSAPYYLTSSNKYRNYYDCTLNLNLGIEFML